VLLFLACIGEASESVVLTLRSAIRL
jgi:hypothetical protein